MFDFPPGTPWIYAWLGAAALVGLIIGWLLGRIGKGRLKRERGSLRSELDEALEARRAAEEATSESGAVTADLQQQLDEARTSLSDADREIDRLRSEADANETRIAQLEGDIQKAGSSQSELGRLTAALGAAEEEADTLRAALSAASVDTDARLAAAESEAQEAVGRAAAVEEALSAVKIERENLRKELENAKAPGTGEDGGITDVLRTQLDEARAEAAEATERLAALEADLEEAGVRLEKAAADRDAALAEADSAGDPGGELAARDHLIKELQVELAGLTDVEDRLRARDAELGELRRSQAAVVATKDSEIRSLQQRLAAADESDSATASAEMAAALQASRDELAAMREKAAHFEQEAAALRSGIADEPAPAPVAAPVPVAAPAPAPEGLEARLDQLQDTLNDKEARIAYLADRVARLESSLGTGRPPAPAPAPAPAPSPPAPVPDPEPAATPAEPAAPAEPDDLTAIWGIGPAIQRKLNSVGITTYEQIAVLRPEDQDRLGDILGDFLDRFEADDWVGQARRLIEERGGVVPDGPLEPIRLVVPSTPDDLTEIKGIGPFIQQTLNGLGVTTFAEIASWTDDDVEHFGEALVIFQGRIAREEWVAQARTLALRG